MIRPWMMACLVTVITAAGALPLPASVPSGSSNAEAQTAPPPRPKALEGDGPPRTMLNPSGLEATIVDREVLLFEDGSWSIDAGDGELEAKAVTRDGRRVALNISIDLETGERRRSWNFDDDHTGMIQVLVSRAISIKALTTPSGLSCLPQVSVRNLTNLDVYRLVVELQFTSADAPPSSTSMLFNTLKHGDAREDNMQPLGGHSCQGLTGTLHVPYCEFTNGLDCSGAVQASPFGLIPLRNQQDSR